MIYVIAVGILGITSTVVMLLSNYELAQCGILFAILMLLMKIDEENRG